MIRLRTYFYLIGIAILVSCAGEPSACFETDPSSVEVFRAVQFHNCSTDSDEYEWNFGDGNTSSDVNPIHAYSDTGNYEVSLRSSTNFGGSESLATTTLHVAMASTKFIGSYEASIDTTNYLLNMEYGFAMNSISLLLDGQLFCTAQCLGDSLSISAQNYWNTTYNNIEKGSGTLSQDGKLDILIVAKDNFGMSHVVSIEATRLNL